ncbi:hypothetical protein Bca52824_011558 [Brassica carinata]|uniref:Uncharacterized protein n=1 Tax=Brassica carinata TaxID=52824 RepID=A0A8X7VX03_BRACI|nr:hypothetical protein Bca52824_011558 [Brassica carinata]
MECGRLINTLYSLNEATLLASEGRSGQLDQHETSLSVVDNPDVLKTRHVGGEEPSRASASNPQRSDVYQPDARTSPPLLSLLEKEPPSRHVSGQLDYVKHITGLEKHESILPLLRASIEKKTNGGDLDFLMAEFAGKQNGNLDTLPRYYSKTMSKKVMAIEGMASASGVLSGSGVLNARLGSDTSSGLLSHMVTTLSAEVASQYLEKVADLLLEFARADTTVKSYMCSQSLLSRLFHMFNRVEPPILLKILKCTNHLSTDPNCLESLQRADAIKHLIPNLEVKEGNLVDQIHHEAVYEHHPRPKQLIVENDLPQRLQNLIEERREGQHLGGQVLVKQMATSLLKALHINTVL